MKIINLTGKTLKFINYDNANSIINEGNSFIVITSDKPIVNDMKINGITTVTNNYKNLTISRYFSDGIDIKSTSNPYNEKELESILPIEEDTVYIISKEFSNYSFFYNRNDIFYPDKPYKKINKKSNKYEAIEDTYQVLVSTFRSIV